VALAAADVLQKLTSDPVSICGTILWDPSGVRELVATNGSMIKLIEDKQAAKD